MVSFFTPVSLEEATPAVDLESANARIARLTEIVRMRETVIANKKAFEKILKDIHEAQDSPQVDMSPEKAEMRKYSQVSSTSTLAAFRPLLEEHVMPGLENGSFGPHPICLTVPAHSGMGHIVIPILREDGLKVIQTLGESAGDDDHFVRKIGGIFGDPSSEKA